MPMINKLKKKYTTREVWEGTDLNLGIEFLRCNPQIKPYLTDIKPGTNKQVEADLLVNLLSFITVTKVTCLEDLCFPESFMLESDGFEFVTRSGVLFCLRKVGKKYYIWTRR